MEWHCRLGSLLTHLPHTGHFPSAAASSPKLCMQPYPPMEVLQCKFWSSSWDENPKGHPDKNILMYSCGHPTYTENFLERSNLRRSFIGKSWNTTHQQLQHVQNCTVCKKEQPERFWITAIPDSSGKMSSLGMEWFLMQLLTNFLIFFPSIFPYSESESVLQHFCYLPAAVLLITCLFVQLLLGEK